MSQPSFEFQPRLSPRFDGATVQPEDQARLSRHLVRVVQLMSDGSWRTLREISEAVGCTEASASARLRDLRKVKFGGFQVERTRVDGGLWMYRVDGLSRHPLAY